VKSGFTGKEIFFAINVRPRGFELRPVACPTVTPTICRVNQAAIRPVSVKKKDGSGLPVKPRFVEVRNF
jgi:hypothetical protein